MLQEKMNPKKKLLLSFALSTLLFMSGAFLKIVHNSFANILLAGGVICMFVFFFFMISFIIKAKID
ncbi:MAG: hypothetical protein LBC48_06105 [Dysgonamonadaceae bacterium]|jgi:hypothetical protein|nr:hypothetical protein [Dysgonamonadaceae bacterium]